MSALRVLAFVFAFAFSLCGGLAKAAESGPNEVGLSQYRFLQNSRWYVPTATLPAVELNLRTGNVRAVIDQTVWDIKRYTYGYFWGSTIVRLMRPVTQDPIGDPVCLRMLGSVTPDGQVNITFINEDQTTAVGAVGGIGTLFRASDGRWRFQMQMATGLTSVIAHSSYMDQCRAGQSCQARLPGTRLSLSQFLALCD